VVKHSPLCLYVVLCPSHNVRPTMDGCACVHMRVCAHVLLRCCAPVCFPHASMLLFLAPQLSGLVAGAHIIGSAVVGVMAPPGLILEVNRTVALDMGPCVCVRVCVCACVCMYGCGCGCGRALAL